MAEGSREALGNSPSDPQYVRITSGGKVKNWVRFCLKFFEENPDRPVVLHTLPPKPQSTETDTTGSESNEDSAEVRPGAEKAKETKPAKSPPSTSTIPRLISVVEIIKREYFKSLPLDRSGLYQYNHLGYLEEDNEDRIHNSPSVKERDRTAYIAAALQGKNFLKQERTPYMSITLSTTPILELESKQTRQDPKIKKPSKSAKARNRRRLKKEKGERSAEGSTAKVVPAEIPMEE